MITFEEIKQAIKDRNIFPNQLFTEEEMQNDRVFGKVFEQVKTFEKERKEFDDKLAEKDQEITLLNRNISEGDAHKKLENILSTFETEDKKLTDLQKNFINKRFNPKDLEEINDEKITDFVNKSLKEYPEYASMFGENNQEGNQEGDQGNTENGSGEIKDEVEQVVEEIFK